jgi:phage gpG-like protein
MVGRPSPSDVTDALSGLRTVNKFGGTMSVTFDFKPSVAILAAKVDKLGIDIRSFREPLERAVKKVMIPSIQTNFDVSGRPAWEQLSEATWSTRAGRGWSGGDILLLTGTLRKTATQFNIWTITQQSATIRDLPQKAWYGKVHQAGAGGSVRTIAPARKMIKGRGGVVKWSGARDKENSRGYVNIPARPFVLIQEEDRIKIQEIFREWLEERVDKHWGRL